jgi:hypothetical protein
VGSSEAPFKTALGVRIVTVICIVATVGLGLFPNSLAAVLPSFNLMEFYNVLIPKQ